MYYSNRKKTIKVYGHGLFAIAKNPRNHCKIALYPPYDIEQIIDKADTHKALFDDIMVYVKDGKMYIIDNNTLSLIDKYNDNYQYYYYAVKGIDCTIVIDR